MKQQLDVVVVGAGVTGLTVAALLANGSQPCDLRITLLDASPRPVYRPNADIGLRVSAISMGSATLLDAVGAWSVVENTRVSAFDHMRVWDEAASPDGPSTLRFDADEFAVPHLGFIVENELLQHAVLALLDQTGVSFRFDTPVASVASCGRGHEVILEDGERLYADLVIAADGAQSRVRTSVGIDLSKHAYEQTAFVTHVATERPHAATAWQRFLRTGPIGLLPLADGRVSVVWTTTPEEALNAQECSDEALGSMLSFATDNVLGKLAVAGPRGMFPLAAQHAEHYVSHGIALIGDAAHTVHPLAGQGANLGLADAATLAEVVLDAQSKGEYAADRPVLRRYERARKGENAAMMHFMTGLNRLFASDSVLLGEIRRAGMTLFNRSGPIRQRIVKVALGDGRQ